MHQKNNGGRGKKTRPCFPVPGVFPSAVRDMHRAQDHISNDSVIARCADASKVRQQPSRLNLEPSAPRWLADPQGIPGMILAVPMVVITRIVCDHLDHPYAKTLMRLLEGNVFEVRASCSTVSFL